jgi:hypothetical protein
MTSPQATPDASPLLTDEDPHASAGKPIDKSALILIALTIAVVGAGLAIRSVATQQRLTQTIQAVVNVGDQLWVALPSELLQINPTTQSVQHLSYRDMQLPSPITYAVKTQNNYWLQLASGQIWRCNLSSLPCKQVVALGDGEDHYYNIAVLPERNQIVAVNNTNAQIMTLDGESGQIISANISYRLPSKSSLGSLLSGGKLNHPNRLHVYNNLLIQTDTGGERVVAWPLDADGLPDWKNPLSVLTHTFGQTYEVLHISRKDPANNRWLVFEAGAQLKEGSLMSYSTQSNTAVGTSIDLGMRDPTLMTNLDEHSVLVADPSMAKIVQVDFSPYNDAIPAVTNYDVAGLVDPLAQLKHKSDLYKLLAQLALLFFLAPFIGIWVLKQRGYNLNQKLG